MYRAVRTVSAARAAELRNKSVVIRNSNGSPVPSGYEQHSSPLGSAKDPQRMVVVRQNTPSGEHSRFFLEFSRTHLIAFMFRSCVDTKAYPS